MFVRKSGSGLRLIGRRGASHALAVVVLALQALLWGGGTIIEAEAAAESLGRSAHVEDTTTSTCPPIHSELDCLVCRTITGGAVGGLAPSVEWAAGLGVLKSEGSNAVAAQRLQFGSLGSRAPPLR